MHTTSENLNLHICMIIVQCMLIVCSVMFYGDNHVIGFYTNKIDLI